MSMAIARDYLQPTETADNPETKLIDQILEGWGKWAQRGDANLDPVAIGFVWRIPDLLILGHELVLSDEKFMLVDRHIAGLPERLRLVVFIEYLRTDEEATSERKAERAHLNRLAYRQRLHAAQWALFSLLDRLLDTWRQRSIYTGAELECRPRNEPA